MMRYFFSLLILSFLTINCERELPNNYDNALLNNAYTELKGFLHENLLLMNSPYLVTEDIYIDSMQNILIEAGVEIFFSKEKRFYINGNLTVSGNKERPVKFTAYKDSTWGGIKIFNSSNSEFSFCVVEKINIENDDTTGIGSIKIERSNVKFSNCVFRGNRSTHGGAIYLNTSSSVINNCIFMDNFSAFAGGAILSEFSNISLVNNTFYKNSSANHVGGVFISTDEHLFIHNNIFYQNTSSTGDPRIEIVPIGSAEIDTAFNFLAFGSLNPNFISESNLHLRTSSPCINSGNPDPVFNDINGSRNDQGAYGGPLGDW